VKAFWRFPLFVLLALAQGCMQNDSSPGSLFTSINAKHSGITFINQLDQNENLNTYTFKNFYNGAGVALGDINNDGLLDIYFCGNTRPNALYLNKGDFNFEDITQKAGVACAGVWSTGVSMVDINADGLLDIYVCKSGLPGGTNRHNELFINNGDLTFSEKSKEYGLDVLGLSIHAAFFDYDRDGDLDCYLLNNSMVSEANIFPEKGSREIFDEQGANMLLRNDDGHFTNVTREAGLFSSAIGFGLGVAVFDINNDGWPDMYISNDFFERDYLYINNGDGTFSEELEEQITETSMGAMGADIADLNNDGFMEIYATEMTAEGNRRQKSKTVYQSWDSYQQNLENGYYHQFARNTLQLNNANGTFSEIGRYAGVSETDWSWGALIFDMDMDGYKDIFVANGIYKDLLDRDFLEFTSNPGNVRGILRQTDEGIRGLVDKIPSEAVSNYAFINNHNLTFTNRSDSLGLAEPGFSNGAAYGDLDNDGDLDLVINNINMPPYLYKNESKSMSQNHFVTIVLKGDNANTAAIGSKVTLFAGSEQIVQENYPNRGFMASVDPRLNFGLGNHTAIDSMIIDWPDGFSSISRNISVDTVLTISRKEMQPYLLTSESKQTPFFTVASNKDLPDAAHKENDFNDFDRYRLLFQMMSNEGPAVAIADVNGDGLDDFYLCGAKDSPGIMMIQRGGKFLNTNEKLFENEKLSEETDCVFFDADGDGDQDLYVASGSIEFPSSSTALVDKLYINDGRGNFKKSEQILPSFTFESTSCVRPADVDQDGDLDLFVGVRCKPFEYGVPADSYLLINDGRGMFTDATTTVASGLRKLGNVTDAQWADVDNDGDLDLMIAGEWMPLTLFINENGKLSIAEGSTGLENSNGWWNVLKAADLDNDGDMDFVAGNHGLNSGFKASLHHPVSMYVNDFDMNGSIEQIITRFYDNVEYPIVMRHDLLAQIPSLASRIPSFAAYGEMTIDSLFDQRILEKSITHHVFRLESSVILNLGNGTFNIIPLPAEAQLTPVMALLVKDWNGDNLPDILLGGNNTRSKPEAGIYCAGYGLFLQGIGGGKFESASSLESGINLKGEIRDFGVMEFNGKSIVIVAKNNAAVEYLKVNQ
jgi:enediyne biosynthesis protein E4